MIAPFLPQNITAQLDETFLRLTNYLDSRDEWNVVDAFDAALQQLQRVAKILDQYGSKYSSKMANGFARHLVQRLEDDFQSNRAAQPATVDLSSRDKKYPLQTVGSEIDVGVSVQNKGPGFANRATVVFAVGEGLEIIKGSGEIQLGRLAPGVKQRIDIPLQVVKPCDTVDVYVCLTWKDFDGQDRETDLDFLIEGQRTGIEWKSLERRDPYSIEPITSEDELIGRKDVLNRLIGAFSSQRIGSAVVFGQKRVGKTSIAKAVESHLNRDGYLVCFIDSGDYVDPNPQKTISNLGSRICIYLQKVEPRLKHIAIPHFDESLTPLGDFLRDVHDMIPVIRLVIIIDEFDELPIDLYLKNALGNSFFLNLRSISSREGIGFLLVGGEKMNHIMSFQGYQLNKWNNIPVDYFNRAHDWSDYRELIQRPVEGYIDYNEDALNMIYEYSAGNPFFTNLICGYIFRDAVRRSDTFVSTREVEDAIRTAANELFSNTFQHFWDDGILETGDKALQVSLQRRKVIIGVAETVESGLPVNADNLKNHELLNDIPISSVDRLLQEFMNRGVFTRDANQYRFQVELFYQWLKAKGLNDLIATFPEIDANLRRMQEEQDKRIGASEIVELVERWGLYKGQVINEDKVRAWLEQFGKPNRQRMMFNILQNLSFYSNSVVREKMKEVDGIVRRGLTKQIQKGKRKRSDILVSYLDSPGKSGAYCARLYADVADIYVDNVIEKGELASVLENRDDIQAIVFIDDFVGTGQSAETYLTEICHDLVSTNKQMQKLPKIVFSAVLAYTQGWLRLQKMSEDLELEIILHYCDMVDETRQCFSDKSAIFLNPDEREQAEQIATEIGFKLEKRNPLGYGNLQLALVFEHGCPNNSLPILWDESSGEFQWRPLFKRH